MTDNRTVISNTMLEIIQGNPGVLSILIELMKKSKLNIKSMQNKNKTENEEEENEYEEENEEEDEDDEDDVADDADDEKNNSSEANMQKDKIYEQEYFNRFLNECIIKNIIGSKLWTAYKYSNKNIDILLKNIMENNEDMIKFINKTVDKE